MKRIGRLIFNAIVAMSLSLGIIAFSAWGIGGRAGHTWHYAYDSLTAGQITQHNWEVNFSGGLTFSSFNNHWTRWTIHRLVIPYWAIITLMAISPALWLRWPPARSAGPPGFCENCGYDLRATPGRCPECGSLATPLP